MLKRKRRLCLCSHWNPPGFASGDVEARSELIALAFASWTALTHQQIAAHGGGIGDPAMQQRRLTALSTECWYGKRVCH
jgi:hypothetical protein